MLSGINCAQRQKLNEQKQLDLGLVLVTANAPQRCHLTEELCCGPAVAHRWVLAGGGGELGCQWQTNCHGLFLLLQFQH